MLSFDPRLELHRALYAVSESKSSHPVPGFIIGSIRLVYGFCSLTNAVMHVCVCPAFFFRAKPKKRLGCSGRALLNFSPGIISGGESPCFR